MKVFEEGYEKPINIPKVGRKILDDAVNEAVSAGKLWITSGPASILDAGSFLPVF